jgi:TPP-dependent trihydroxycyclohexane-1,2-dione (THcHDO) dehydratase
MPYALIPDGYSLKQVTKLQKEAVDAKRRHDNVSALLNNPNTPVVIGGAVATFFGVRFASDVIEDLESKGVALTDDVKQKVREAVDKVNPLNVDLTKVAKGLGADTGLAPSVTLEEVLAEARRRFL